MSGPFLTNCTAPHPCLRYCVRDRFAVRSRVSGSGGFARYLQVPVALDSEHLSGARAACDGIRNRTHSCGTGPDRPGSVRDTADDNYIAARWCFVEGLNVDYFWLSVHALEKYMKAALLLNGRSAKGYRDRAGCYQRFGHNIDTLYGQVGSIATGLLPDTVVRPDMLEFDSWRDETPEAFVRRLHCDGNADNRYQIFGFVQHREDLFKLDAMVFALRRLCVRLPSGPLPTRQDQSHESGCTGTPAGILGRFRGLQAREDRRRPTWRAPARRPAQVQFSVCPGRFRTRNHEHPDGVAEPDPRTFYPGTSAPGAAQGIVKLNRL